MNVQVRYYTRSGNTKKLADAIAAAAGTKAETVAVALSEKADILFLGSSVYAGGVDESVKKFIKENKDKIGKIYNFSTAALPVSTYKNVKKTADEVGVEMAEKDFRCKGSFMVMNKNRPNEDDLKAAEAFVKEVLG